MAVRRIKWVDNGIGLWRSEDGKWGIFTQTNGLYRLQYKTGPEPWDWEVIGFHRTFDDAAAAARDVQAGR